MCLEPSRARQKLLQDTQLHPQKILGPKHAGFWVFSLTRTYFSLRKESVVAELQEDQEQQEVRLVISESICSSNERICPPNGIFGIKKKPPNTIKHLYIHHPSISETTNQLWLIFISFPNMFYTFPTFKVAVPAVLPFVSCGRPGKKPKSLGPW